MMETVKSIFSFFKTRISQFEYLKSVLDNSYYEPSISRLIEDVIDENGTVKTTASTELTRIRKSLQRNRAESDRIYLSVINKYRKKGWLTESEESSRNGRRVIAIVAEQKRSISGIIHDSSATGRTAFIEPVEATEINNAIASLEAEEQIEINRILKELSNSLRKFVPLMQIYRQQIGAFDFFRSKALFAIQTDSHLPKIKPVPIINLKEARHPLLLLHNNQLKKTTVPFSLKLDSDARILVISGPNAGGKTVCMKTSGLLQLMLQSGMLVSAHPDSEFGIFDNLMVDIGDSQSIEYELSTYSSRLRHMKVFLEKVNSKSLFLIDEFGTGTDPNLGGALAEAVLEELNFRKGIGIITTHYLNLKVLADRTEGIINGSMEFDLKKLKPLYRLVIGKPGSSYTFLVAERSGLPRTIIKNARRKVARKSLLLEKLLTEVQYEKSNLKHLKIENEAKEKLLKEEIKKYESLSAKIKEEYTSKEIKIKKNEAKLIQQTEQKFKSFLKEWKKAKNKKTILDKYYKEFSKKKKEDSPEQKKKKRAEKLKVLREIIVPGASVRLNNGFTTGIVEQIDQDKVYVIFGQFRTVCDMANLLPADEEKK